MDDAPIVFFFPLFFKMSHLIGPPPIFLEPPALPKHRSLNMLPWAPKTYACFVMVWACLPAPFPHFRVYIHGS